MPETVKVLEASYAGRNQMLVNIDHMPDWMSAIESEYVIMPRSQWEAFKSLKTPACMLIFAVLGVIAGYTFCVFQH